MGGNGGDEKSGASKAEISTIEYTEKLTKVKKFADLVVSFDRLEACEIMSMWLDELRTGLPIAPFTTVEAEAESWAALATPVELETYHDAILTKLDGQALGTHARKRLFLSLWEGFSFEERASFLRRVDPVGEFRRAS